MVRGETWIIHSASRGGRSVCGVCSRGCVITRGTIWIKMMYDGRLCKWDLWWGIARSIDSTTENRVDATINRAARNRTLMVLEGAVQVVFHRGGKRVDNRTGTQLQPIVNQTDVIILLVGCGNVGYSNVMYIRRIPFRRWAMIHISNGRNILSHRGEWWIIAHSRVTRRAMIFLTSVWKMNQMQSTALSRGRIWIGSCQIERADTSMTAISRWWQLTRMDCL